jgi:hypothetical protein
MQNAAKQYKVASTQLEDSNTRNAQLLAELDSMRQKSTDNVHQPVINRLQFENDNLQLENENLRREVINIQGRVKEHELRHEIDDEERQRLTRDIDTMKSLLSSRGEEKTALGKIDQLIMENQALRSSRDEIQERNLVLSSENETLQQQIHEMRLYRDDELDIQQGEKFQLLHEELMKKDAAYTHLKSVLMEKEEIVLRLSNEVKILQEEAIRVNDNTSLKSDLEKVHLLLDEKDTVVPRLNQRGCGYPFEVGRTLDAMER